MKELYHYNLLNLKILKSLIIKLKKWSKNCLIEHFSAKYVGRFTHPKIELTSFTMLKLTLMDWASPASIVTNHSGQEIASECIFITSIKIKSFKSNHCYFLGQGMLWKFTGNTIARVVNDFSFFQDKEYKDDPWIETLSHEITYDLWQIVIVKFFTSHFWLTSAA